MGKGGQGLDEEVREEMRWFGLWCTDIGRDMVFGVMATANAGLLNRIRVACSRLLSAFTTSFETTPGRYITGLGQTELTCDDVKTHLELDRRRC